MVCETEIQTRFYKKKGNVAGLFCIFEDKLGVNVTILRIETQACFLKRLNERLSQTSIFVVLNDTDSESREEKTGKRAGHL